MDKRITSRIRLSALGWLNMIYFLNDYTQGQSLAHQFPVHMGRGIGGQVHPPFEVHYLFFFPVREFFSPFHFYATPLARHAMDAFPMSVEPKGVGREEEHSAVIEQK